MLARINKNYVPAYWDDFFNNSFFNQLNSTTCNGSRPAVNVSEDDKSYTIEVAAPGIARKAFNLEIENDVLTISTEKRESKSEQKQNFLRREFNYQTFKRSFQLPETIDQEQIRATHETGILTLTLPMKEEVVQKAPRQIEVQ
ncbi:MAG: Hsp20/alpha crystallin family protein [Bacteroidales bacterium]|nr:Hsp20/alpha crystallin family protein [Bacteroidales bacterium]